MRASTLLGLAIALMLGVVAVGGIKYSGILNKPPEQKPPPPEVKLVLVAKKNLFEDTAATLLDVGLRAAKPEELDFIRKNPEKLLPANPEAANMRIVKHNVPADQLLLKEDFKDLDQTKGLGVRLKEGMRAVDIEVPKERAAAGLLRIGEHVDVFLTTKILTDPSVSAPRTAIAPIAKNLRIIGKRGATVPFMAPIPEDKPLSFILEANPYRAALIEYAKSKGILTLVASSQPAPGPDDASEQIRVISFLDGKTAVGEVDLERIFHLPPLIPRQPPLRVEHMNGTKVSRVSIIDPDGSVVASGSSYRFVSPEEAPAPGSQPKKTNPVPANPISAKPPPAKKK
jgi:Flp pilus assembly protein CpaB